MFKIISPSQRQRDLAAYDCKANWETWKQRIRVKLWEAVALASDIEPSGFSDGSSMFGGHSPKAQELRCRLDTAIRSVGEGLHPVEIDVDDEGNEVAKELWKFRLAEFGAWAANLGWRPPRKFPRRKAKTKWPWGNHNTILLTALAEAGELWRNYDPNSPATAPNNDEVKDVLLKAGVKIDRLRVAMARILSADDRKPGPHNNVNT